jgi:hypothetical protein
VLYSGRAEALLREAGVVEDQHRLGITESLGDVVLPYVVQGPAGLLGQGPRGVGGGVPNQSAVDAPRQGYRGSRPASARPYTVRLRTSKVKPGASVPWSPHQLRTRK